MSLDKNLKLWLPLTKNAKNRGSKDVQTIVNGGLIFDTQYDSLAPFPSYAYFSDTKIEASFKNVEHTNFTISWWERPENTLEMLDSWSLILDGGDYITLYKTGTPCKLSCFIEDNLNEIIFFDDYGNPVTDVCDGHWHFYALTYKVDETNEKNVFTLYKDNDFIGTAIWEKVNLNFKGLNIGVKIDDKGGVIPFNGFICDFRMYDYDMGNREIREKLAYNKKFDFMAIGHNENVSKPIFYDNSGINLFKLVLKKEPIIHGNSIVFTGDNELTIYADKDGLNMQKGFLSAWFIPYEPNNNISTIFIDSSSEMALGICKDKSGNYKLLINCSEPQFETSFENIQFNTINNVLIEYDKIPINVIVNGIPQSINTYDGFPYEKYGFCIGGTTKGDCSFFGEILKISIYGANYKLEFLQDCYRPTLNMLKNSLASTLQTSLNFLDSQYTIIDLFSSELPKESVKFVFYFTPEITTLTKNKYLMYFAVQEFGIKIYYNNGPCVGVKFNDKEYLIGQFTVNENKLSIEIKGEECICQLDNNSPFVFNVGDLLEELSPNDEIIIGANNKYGEKYTGNLNVLKIYYDDILSRKLIGAENYKQGNGLYDIKTDKWYFSESETPF